MTNKKEPSHDENLSFCFVLLNSNLDDPGENTFFLLSHRIRNCYVAKNIKSLEEIFAICV